MNNDELEPDEICISFIEMKNYFISEMAHKYLINSGLNKDFNLEEYVCTKLSEGLTTEVTLVPMFENQNVASRGHSL
uniref:hypothetical protein n=1 Tax=Wolbachia endosymbiont of Ctenocephalides felis wCfeT TaxID=2732593 RepID=UPI00144796AB|nr:hypothetical protein [Wolbachia endosymbiont of Ctenocephalides felis wCfeT]